MKILAFTDFHSDIASMKKFEELARKEKPDICLCPGDLTIFEDFIEQIIERLSKLPKPVYLLHGNHEAESVVRKLCSFYDNITFMHKKIVEVGEYTLIGYGGGGFSKKDRGFEEWAKTIEPKIKGKKVILLTHAPPYDTKLDKLWEHRGCKSYTDFCKKHDEIVLYLSGHFHDTFGKEDKLNKARAINPGPNGMIIEL